jgi:sulfur relay (sulfurtransferase) complex TusBCD TusD component (DsrE family)
MSFRRNPVSKTAIVVLSDPASGSEEALGRLFNAMFVAHELKEKGQEVALIFQGAGTRWANEIVKPDHPAHSLYGTVKDTVAGVCGGCADVFGATADVKAAGLALIREKEIPGTTGIVNLSRYLDEGYRLLTF